MNDQGELHERRPGAGLNTDATWLAFVSTLVGGRHNRCDDSVASRRCFTALGSRMSEMLLLTNSAQVSAIVHVAAPVASAVARAWGVW